MARSLSTPKFIGVGFAFHRRSSDPLRTDGSRPTGRSPAATNAAPSVRPDCQFVAKRIRKLETPPAREREDVPGQFPPGLLDFVAT